MQDPGRKLEIALELFFVTQGEGEGRAQEEKLETDMLDAGPLHSFVNLYLKQ